MDDVLWFGEYEMFVEDEVCDEDVAPMLPFTGDMLPKFSLIGHHLEYVMKDVVLSWVSTCEE